MYPDWPSTNSWTDFDVVEEWFSLAIQLVSLEASRVHHQLLTFWIPKGRNFLLDLAFHPHCSSTFNIFIPPNNLPVVNLPSYYISS